MFKRFYPDIYIDSAYDIDYEGLYNKGYRGIIFDIDNTLVEHGAPVTKKCSDLFDSLRAIGFDTCIISTPTGSTGYNMSAGGPIVDPKAQMMLITPINDHNLSSKSIVISADEEVTVELGKRRSQKDEMVEVSFDGDSKVRLEVGDRFVVRRAEDTAKICKLSSESFLEILRRKMSAYT